MLLYYNDFFNYDFICNYSDWSNAKLVNIVQRNLKGGHTYIFKRERVDYRTYGSILKYNLKKDYLNNNELEEVYSVCEGPIDNHKYYFDELDKDLFKQFMLGNITIEELLKENYKKEVKGHSLELIFGKKNF